MLHRQNGDLYVEQVPLKEIQEHHGTPTFVYSEGMIRAAYEAFSRAFHQTPHRVCYAVKANSNLAILQLLADLGAGFDIVSGGELERVLAAGGQASSVVFSGVGKLDWELEAALDAGIGCFNVESRSELSRLIELASHKNMIAPISIRVNPDVDPLTHPYISTGLKENKFGVTVEEALALYQVAASSSSIHIVGMDCHIGSQITTLSPYLDALDRVLALTDELRGLDISLEHLDLGGGMGIRYKDETPLDLEELASAIGQMMSGRKETLVFEPGRFIVGNAGLLLTEVNTLKENDGKGFAVVDAAMNDLIRPALYDAWHDVEAVSDLARDEQIWDIVGPVCETGDFLAKGREMALSEGDLIAILSAGAYSFVMSSNYNSRGRAAEVLVDGDQHYAIRRRETIADLTALEALKPA